MENFVIDSYGKKTTFASFLPGIAGIKGIPIWCYYVNRGQGVVSFGVDNKDHAIMEFYPAHTAYQNVKRTGFRTFIKSGGKFAESFADEDNAHKMLVGANTLSIEEDNNDTGLRTKVTYFVLPEEKIGGLVRKVCIENISDEDKETINKLVADGKTMKDKEDVTAQEVKDETDRLQRESQPLFQKYAQTAQQNADG